MNDEAIISMLFERSEKSIDALERKYGRNCRAIALGILGDDRDAEECVNDAYLGVWNTVPPENPKPLSTFLYRILRNIALKKKRQSSRAKRNSVYDEALEEIHEMLASDETVEVTLERMELRKNIKEFLRSLPEENRVIFVRRYWFMESCEHIAKTLGVSENTIAARLYRIREKMRRYLKERGVDV